MRILEAGHIYKLDEVTTNTTDVNNFVTKMEEANLIRFVNNEGPKFYNGTQTQEILRVLIDRTMHCDNCLRWLTNDKIIYHLRMALVLHEARALERKTEKGLISPECISLDSDGHYFIGDPENMLDFISEDAKKYFAKDKR